MKKSFALVDSLGIRKLLAILGFAAMLVLLCTGPTMLRASQKHIVPTPTETTAAPAPTTGTKAVDGSAVGFDPSTFNVAPITNSDGSISFPTYTVPTNTYSSLGATGAAWADPDKCAAARAAMDSISASYVDGNNQLQQQINNYQSFLTNNSKMYVARGSGPNADEQAENQRVTIALQTANNKLMSNVREMNSKLAPYQQQLTANACV